eukprot:1039332-Prorocentrum_lima.AAC.1
MTSSLVGSEMCIRDSLSILDQALCAERGPERLAEQLFGPHGRGSQPLSCLLYTSDAADDM